jgi:NAD(P)-dependent dehydrogenase (short-subunit alcohol dehydrogenase family)
MRDAAIPPRGGRFAGQSALVVGGSRGLGRAVALALAAEGARVLAAGRDPRALAELRTVARARGLRLSTARGDASRRAGARALVAAARKTVGGPDLLVHSAGDYWEGPLSGLREDAWDSLIRSNLGSALLVVQEALPGMRRRRNGRILLFGVAGCEYPRAAPRAHAYRAAKTALLTLARSVAVEEAGHGITVNVLLPGIIRTVRVTRARAEALRPRIPARRLGTPQEVARAALFLLAPESGYITGAALPIAGGYLL